MAGRDAAPIAVATIGPIVQAKAIASAVDKRRNASSDRANRYSVSVHKLPRIACSPKNKYSSSGTKPNTTPLTCAGR